MKKPKEQSLRWLRQSEYDLEKAQRSLGEGDFSYAAFFAEQSAQKSLKAFLMFRGERFVNIHSVSELAKEAVKFDASFSSFIDKGKRLDRHYLASRYPDALPEPAIPAESYTKEEAEGSVAIAKEIFEACKGVTQQ